MAGSSTFPINGNAPQQILFRFNNSGVSLVKNVGAVPIFIDDSSSVNALTSFSLNIGASIEWQPGIELWAIVAAGFTSTLDVISSGLKLFDPVSIGQADLAARTPAVVQPSKQYALNAVGATLPMGPGYETLELWVTAVPIVGALFSRSSCVIEWFIGASTGPVDTFDLLGPGTNPFDQPGIAYAKMAVKGTSYRVSFYDQQVGTGANGGFFVTTVASFAKTNQNLDLRQFPILGGISAAYQTMNDAFPQQELFTYSEAGLAVARDIILPVYSGFVDMAVSYSHTTAGTVTAFLFLYPTNPGTAAKLGDVLVLALPITNSAQFRSTRVKLPPQPCRISFSIGAGNGNFTLQIALTESAI